MDFTGLHGLQTQSPASWSTAASGRATEYSGRRRGKKQVPSVVLHCLLKCRQTAMR